MKFDEGLIFKAELRGTMNSLELSTDMLYKDINFRICQAQRQQIITSQALLRENLETLRDEKGRTLFGHVTGEAAIIHKCGIKMVKPRRGEERCCREMPVWMGDDFKTPGFNKPVSREITSICTLRICNEIQTLFTTSVHHQNKSVLRFRWRSQNNRHPSRIRSLKP